MADRQPDDVGFDLLERAQMAFARVQRDPRRPGKRFLAARMADARREVGSPSGESRLDRDVWEVLGGQRAALAVEAGAEQDARQLTDIAWPSVAHQQRERVIADRQR